jgi:hypothetical protein
MQLATLRRRVRSVGRGPASLVAGDRGSSVRDAARAGTVTPVGPPYRVQVEVMNVALLLFIRPDPGRLGRYGHPAGTAGPAGPLSATGHDRVEATRPSVAQATRTAETFQRAAADDHRRNSAGTKSGQAEARAPRLPPPRPFAPPSPRPSREPGRRTNRSASGRLTRYLRPRHSQSP